MLSNLAKGLKPYVAGEQPQDKKYIKLNTNENPYPPSKNVDEVIRDFSAQSLSLYPDPNSTKLKRAIAQVESASSLCELSEQNVFVGNGSDEVLAQSFQAFFSANDKCVLFPNITYSFYTVYCNLFGINYQEIPLNADFSLNIDDYKQPSGGIVITNPNAPTSLSLTLEQLEEIVSSTQQVVIVDEAYIDFATKSSTCTPLLAKYSNLVIVKTFSKSHSLAGIRCGYALAAPQLIAGLCMVKDSFNSYPIDRICELVATASILDTENLQRNTAQVVATREWTIAKLRELEWTVLESDANFLFAKSKTLGGQYVYTKCKEMGVLVRHFNKPLVSEFVRISIGTRAEMEQLVGVLSSL